MPKTNESVEGRRFNSNHPRKKNVMDLKELAQKLYVAKRAEDAAKQERIEVEEQIAALVETPENGSKTVDAGDGIKVTVKRGLSYKADVDAMRTLDIPEDRLPLKFVPPVPAGYAFDEKAYEKLQTADPGVFTKLAAIVTTTPRKVGVTIKIA